jgi:hypothetical protein
MSLHVGLPVPPEPSPSRERLKTALCLLAILAAVGVSFRPGGLFGDDELYFNLVKGFFTGHPLQNLHDGDGGLFMLRPLGYPLFLSLFYPVLGQHWELYPFITAVFCFLLGVVTFFFFRLRMDKGYALVFTLAMLCNPMIRLWSTNAYSDIPFTFFMVLFIYLFTTKKALDALPFLALFMVSLRTSGLPLAGAYGIALAVRKEKKRLVMLAGLLAAYFVAQRWYFGEIPGIQDYFRTLGPDGVGVRPLPLPIRMLHNLRSLLTTLLSSTFFYGGYAWMQASFLKSFLCLMTGGAALLCLAVAAGRSVFLNLLIAGYFALILMLPPEDLVHRILIPLIPLVFLGAGRLAAVADTMYMPRVRQALVGVALLAAIDGVVSMHSYQAKFRPRDYSDVYRTGESAQGPTGNSPERAEVKGPISDQPISGRPIP